MKINVASSKQKERNTVIQMDPLVPNMYLFFFSVLVEYGASGLD